MTGVEVVRMLTDLADQVDLILGRIGIRGRVTDGFIAPRRIVLRYERPMYVRSDALARADEELSRALRTSVRVSADTDGLLISIARTDDGCGIVRLSNLLRGLVGVPPMTAVLGVDDSAMPTLIDLRSPTVRHVLISGRNERAKTALMKSIALSLLFYNNDVRVMYQPAPSDLVRWMWTPYGYSKVVAFYERIPDDTESLSIVLESGWRMGAHVVMSVVDHALLGELLRYFPTIIVEDNQEELGDFVVHTAVVPGVVESVILTAAIPDVTPEQFDEIRKRHQQIVSREVERGRIHLPQLWSGDEARRW